MKKPPTVNDDICFCPLSGILDVIVKEMGLLIIAIPGNGGEKGFNELKSELGSISPKPLSDPLKNPGKIGLVRKKILETSQPTVKYSFTSDGREMPARSGQAGDGMGNENPDDTGMSGRAAPCGQVCWFIRRQLPAFIGGIEKRFQGRDHSRIRVVPGSRGPRFCVVHRATQ